MHIMRGRSSIRKFLSILLVLSLAISGCMPVNTDSSGGAKTPAGQSGAAPIHKSPDANTNGNSMTTYDVWKAEDAEKVSLRKPGEPVRGIYVTSHVARSRRMDELIALVDQTELNAMVVDINSGMALTALPKSPRAASYPISNTKSAKQMKQLIAKLKQHRIYTIARIITFKNPELARAVPSWSIKRKDGRVWQDRGGSPWIDPYRQEAWEYPLKLAEHAASIGFDEIQFDYVRFPENEKRVDREVAYANPNKWTKSEAIRKFLHRASVRAHKAGARISADVFGLVGSSTDDMGIGQSWKSIASEVDVVSPMIYPSHYADGIWGVAHPDLTPSPIIARALKDITRQNERMNAQGIDTAKVRPWLQSFTATWVHPHQRYGLQQVKEQIAASRAAGYPSYLLWNSANRYPQFDR
ncbi:putative glycoside hydrolase [Cohnella sp. GCM10027633]|uniref:putative glycoside hydrolase n=1 Tax=unclassified Cohnella TaxID=2636738 RepID=UPI0036279FA5